MRLTDICDFQGGSQPPKSEWSDIQKDGYIRMLQIRDYTQQNAKVEYIKKTNSTKTCNENDILIARYGASVGKILTGLSGAYNVAMMKVIPDEDIISKRFLYQFLKSNIFQRYINNVGQRAAQAGFNKDELAGIEINLPSKEEQEKIANKFDKLQEIIDIKEKQIEELNVLINSQFVEMFMRKEFTKEKLINNIQEMFIGPFGSALKNECFVEETNGYCVVYEQKHAINKNINNFRWVDENKYNSLKRFNIKSGDIIVSCRGTIGKTYVIPENSPLGIMHPSIMKIRLKKDKYIPEFFEKVLEYYLMENENRTNGATIKMGIKASLLENEEFIIPDIEWQKEYLNFVKLIDKQKFEIQKSLEEMQKLQESLMNKYFGG